MGNFGLFFVGVEGWVAMKVDGGEELVVILVEARNK